MKMLLTLTINDREHTRAINPTTTLLEFLREELDLTGTKKGCDNGECGLCSILVNGKPILACLILAVEAEGQKIISIEGIGTISKPHVLQTKMVEEGAIQCGYCTPAMVINGVSLLRENPKPNKNEIKKCISGTICRCTGYTKIEKAILEASKEIGEPHERE